jgi:hypothetical protein
MTVTALTALTGPAATTVATPLRGGCFLWFPLIIARFMVVGYSRLWPCRSTWLMRPAAW